MAGPGTTIRIFIASPGDTAAERRALDDVVQDVNLALSQLVPGRATVQVVRWENDVVGSFGRPQSVINDQVGDYDVLVAMMWRRFGTPTGTAGSGTEEEIRAAYDRWQETGRPDVLLYFSLGEAPPPATTAEVEQLAKVVGFKSYLEGIGLVKTYANAAAFPAVVRRDLFLLLGRLLHGAEAPVAAARQLIVGPKAGIGAPLDTRIRDLAAEYVAIRRSMARGDARTRQMELVMTRMRALAAECYSGLDALTASPSAGERLAAVAFLQALPHPGELVWLADRFEAAHEERAFLQYHAAAALLVAARELRQTYHDAVSTAVHRALPLAEAAAGRDSDRYRVVTEAVRVLDEPPGGRV